MPESVLGPGAPSTPQGAATLDAPTHRQQERRQQNQRGPGRGERGGDAGVPDRAQAHQRKPDHPRDRDGDRQRGVDDRAARRPERGPDRLVRRLASPELLAITADDQQAVVDGQAQSEEGHGVHRDDRHVGDSGEQPQDADREEHGREADGERERGREDAAEDDDECEQRQRQRHHLAAYGVLLALRVHLVLEHRVAADAHRQAVVLALEPGQQVRQPLVDLVLVADDRGQDQRLVAIGATQLWRSTRRPVRLDAFDVGLAGQPLGQRGAGADRVRVVDVGSFDEEHQVGLGLTEPLLQHVRGGRRLRSGIVEPAGLQPVEQRRTRDRCDQHQHQRRGQDRVPPPDHQVREPVEHRYLLLRSTEARTWSRATPADVTDRPADGTHVTNGGRRTVVLT
jgi:hypothetical protein